MRGRSLRFLTIFAAAAALAAIAGAATRSEPPTSTGTGGAAATVDRLASEAALTILRAGGTQRTPPLPQPPSSALRSRSLVE